MTSGDDLPWDPQPIGAKPNDQASAAQKRDADVKYPGHLMGYGNRPLKRPRGLRGSKFGPASEGRKLSPEEIAEVEAQLKEEGTL